MALYSHSRLGTYETCKFQYKCRYIDKIKVDIDTIEKHLGKVVHLVLEKLYKDLLMGKMNTKEAIVGYYEKVWERDWHEKIMIVKQEYEASHYWKRGERSVADYYDSYYPFDQGKTIGLERPVMFDLDKEGKHKIRGFIDRLVYAGEGVYEIHDYKTASSPPTEESLKEDRQLALYQIDIQEKFEDAKKVKLIWHYLTFGKEFVSYRTQDQLEELKKATIARIEEVEAATEFLPKENPICPWCDYQAICPVRKHLVKVEAMPLEEYLKEDGVKLVNRYVELSDNMSRLEKELLTIKDALSIYAKREGCDVVRGKSHKIRMYEDSYWRFPGTGLKEKPLRDELEKILIEAGRSGEVFHLDVHALSRKLDKTDWPADILEKIKKYATQMTTKRFIRSKVKGEEPED